MYLFSMLVLPGTLAHELAHFFVGFALNAGPSGFSVFPRKNGQIWELGSVKFSNIRWYNGLFVGLAPLLLLPAGIWVAHYQSPLFKGLAGVSPASVAWLYLCATLLGSALPSGQDIKVVIQSSWALIALVGLVLYLRINGVF